jgi:hypothetical protein
MLVYFLAHKPLFTQGLRISTINRGGEATVFFLMNLFGDRVGEISFRKKINEPTCQPA